jgi:hypothetical protein
MGYDIDKMVHNMFSVFRVSQFDCHYIHLMSRFLYEKSVVAFPFREKFIAVSGDPD